MSERMGEHVSRWIAAYHDGELSGERLRMVEAHLAACPACRREAEDLRALSAMLRQSPAHQPRTRADRFAAQVALRLPPAEVRPARRSLSSLAWRSIPFALVAVWAFIQAAVLVTTPALSVMAASPRAREMLAGLADLAPGALTMLLPGVPFVGEILPRGLLSSWFIPLGEIALLNLLFTVAIAAMFAAWLAVWWISSREKSGAF